MKILVLNCGSSSLKYQLLNMDTDQVIAKGTYERIGEQSFVTHKINGEKYKFEHPVKNHKEAIDFMIELLLKPEYNTIKDLSEIDGIGHRVAHGGDKFSSSVVIDEDVISKIDECSALAPVHNKAAIVGIRAAMEAMPGKPNIAVFDTVFHQTIPEERYMYPIPYKYYEKYGIRKYGFHGTSHKYVSQKVAEVMGKDIKDLKIITCHLGNGASLCAVKNGVSVDTSMGFTPLEGVAMGTRCGNIDPAIVTFLMKEEGLSADEVNDLMNKKSGVLGVSGISSDFRDIEDGAFKDKDPRAILALKVFEYKVRATIGSYAAIMGGVDAIVFTAGVGENGPETREECLKGLEFLGVEVDKEANNVRGKIREISKPGCKVKAFVIPTNEELMIARDTLELIQK